MTNDKSKSYPLYDVPYLVRSSNDYYMSAARRRIRERNQAIVDDYFIARDQGASARMARKRVAAKYGITLRRFQNILVWFYREALNRKKYDFLEKFEPKKEHISRF